MPMTPALAGKMAVEVVLIVIAYALFVYGVGRFLGWLGSKYPRLYEVEPRPISEMMREGVTPICEKFFDENAFALDTPLEKKAASPAQTGLTA